MFLFFPLPKNLVWQPALSASVCPCISWNSSLYTRPPFELVLAPYMYVSLRGLFVNMYASAHAQTVLSYLARCFQSPRTIVCVSVCMCVCVLETLQLSHHIYLF